MWIGDLPSCRRKLQDLARFRHLHDEARIAVDTQTRRLKELRQSLQELSWPRMPGARPIGMNITAGTRIGSYEVKSPLGEGGMGIVYRATDLKLQRDVALKLLPQHFAADPMRLARFQREAQVLAALNHPNIAQIYGLEESPGGRCIVMELVDGEMLQQRLRRGPIPPGDALRIVLQITEALEAADERDIVHRDLKPGNIMLTRDGKVKVLDFGLAKAIQERQASDLSNSPTLLNTLSTPGVILGTVSYMSPEQARGEEADRRSDIFSLGVIWYEMLTGSQAFEGETASDVLAQVLKSEPDLNLLPKVSRRTRELLRRCLEKNPKRRWHAVGDLRIEIESVLAGVEAVSEGAEAFQPSGWKRAAPALLTFILGASLAALLTSSLRPASEPRIVSRFTFTLPEGQFFSVGEGFSVGARHSLAISPDGAQIVYVANVRLYVRRMGEQDARPIPATGIRGGIADPVFSPDANFIAFFADDLTIKRIPVSGGAAVTLCSVRRAPYGMSWTDAGILFGQGADGIMRIPADGGKPETLFAVQSGEMAASPQLLPDGTSVLFSVASGSESDLWDRASIVVQKIGSSERKTLIEGGSDARYVPTGHLIYAFSGTLRAAAFDLRRLAVAGAAIPVVEGIRHNPLSISGVGAAEFSFSSNGSLVYIPGPVTALPNSSLVMLDRDGRGGALKLQSGSYSAPRIAPDGKHVAFQTDSGKEASIWIYNPNSGGTVARRLTFDGNSRFPIWSPDSKWIAFQSDREGDLGVFRQRADGSEAAVRLTRPDAGVSHIPDAWSPDGEVMLVEVKKETNASLWAFALRNGKGVPFDNVQNSTIDAVFSPDGRWVAYSSTETGRPEIFVQPFPATGTKYQIPTRGLNHAPVFSHDGRELFFTPGPNRCSVTHITTQPVFAAAEPIDTFTGCPSNSLRARRNFDVTPDGKQIIFPVAASPTSGGSSRPQINIVLNWFEELKQRVPTH